MAEFCLECWNRLNDTEYSKKKYIISEELELCEGCGEYKPIIIMERRAYYMHKLRYFLLPFRIIYSVLYLIWAVALHLYLLCRKKHL